MESEKKEPVASGPASVDGRPVSNDPSAVGGPAAESITAEAARTGVPLDTLESGRKVLPLRSAELSGKVPMIRRPPPGPSTLEVKAVDEAEVADLEKAGWERGVSMYRYLPGRPVGKRETRVFAADDLDAARAGGWQAVGDEIAVDAEAEDDDKPAKRKAAKAPVKAKG